jgi:arylsulfatase A-like enzyme
MRRGFLALGALTLVACRAPQRAGAAGNQSASQPFARPNVLLITIDALRADHLGVFGYRRRTSPHIDALGASAAVFERAYTFWPKTRGSFAMMLTGQTASRNGFSARRPGIADLNPTLASVLHEAGYRTEAAVDNPNVAKAHGYAKGFDAYLETWEDPRLATEMDRARAITAAGIRALTAPPRRPLFLWLHYVNPHGPYSPPPPYDTAFLDEEASSGLLLRPVVGFHGGVRREWAAGRRPLGYYVSQYDGEIAAADAEVGRILDALQRSPAGRGTVVVVASDHGESLGEHDYYFDHGEDLFDPCLRVPLIVRVPGAGRERRIASLATTLDIVPTILDAVKVSYPPELSGESLLPEILGRSGPERARLFAQNDRGLVGTFDPRYKLVATPSPGGPRFAFLDRAVDPSETRDEGPRAPDRPRDARRELELFVERSDRESAATERLFGGTSPRGDVMSPEACEKLKALGYVAGSVRCGS